MLSLLPKVLRHLMSKATRLVMSFRASTLAEQSHVLAMNTTIGTAKVAEAGRGFGVVAKEVKTLAVKSQKATTKVYALLHGVSQAVAAAMEATQEGTDSVEVGVNKSMGTSELLRDIIPYYCRKRPGR